MRSKTCVRVLCAIALLGFGVGAAKADEIAGIDFGIAGPGHWGILALGGSNAAGFGSQATTLSMTGPGAGVYGTASNANIGLAGPSSAGGWGGTVTVDGTLYYDTGNVNTSGQKIVGGIVQNPSLLQTAASNAASGLAAANSLFSHGCTAGIGGVGCNGSLSGSVTITPGNPGGQNVLILSNANLSNNAVITLGDGGNPNTTWVIDDKGDLTTSHSSILAQNSNWSSVLFVVNGQEHTTGGLNQESILDGVYIVPTGTAQNSPGQIDGELIAGGNQITFVSGGSVVVPEPGAIVLYGSGLLLAAYIARYTSRRKSRKAGVC